jgi:hypothetical protein
MGTHRAPWRALALCAGLWPACLLADGLNDAVLDEVIITASGEEPGPAADSASAGMVGADELEHRPLLRTGDLLETVPGLIVTQHSGDGKANQYFLRGFDLDHGTDFATSVEGMPVNLPTHAHGQGYSDLNFLIPELVDHLVYKKGPYYADAGDFSAAGAVDITLIRRLDRGILSAAAGEYGYARALGAGSTRIGDGDLLLGAQAREQNGPWVLPEGYRSLAGVLKYTHGASTGGFSFEGMGYGGHWRATDQIPLRAVEQGIIPRFGDIDPTDGGTTHRYSLSAAGWTRLGRGELRANLYAIDYFLDLFSNFTYFEDPLPGDQFEQYDRRHVYGGDLSWQQPLGSASEQGSLSAGVQVRDDQIDPVGLYETTDRVRWKTVSATRVSEWHYAGFISWSTSLAPRLRMALGARLDTFRFDVDANLAANSGDAEATVASPKATLVFGPWKDTEYFLNLGRGFHSNDARGTTIAVDPNDGKTAVPKVSPLARAYGAEVGVRTTLIPRLQLDVSVWTLKLDSELTLDTDASAIVPTPATRRYGVEFGARYRPWDFVLVNADLALTHARYINPQLGGQYLPNSLRQVASIGTTVNRDTGWYGGAQLRYFGAAPITQDDAVRSHPSLRVSLDAGYHFGSALAATVSVYNLLNRRDDDIEYYYASRLRTESAPVDDIHFHPAEPRSVRTSLTWRF